MSKTIAAGVFIIRKDTALLVCHPTNHDPNFWSIPKGKVDEGETFQEAAIRETFEETNIDLSSDDAISSFTVHQLPPVTYGHKKKILYPFVYVEHIFTKMDWDNIEIKCNSNVSEDRGGFPEMDAYRFVTLHEAQKLLHETQVACIPKIWGIINGKTKIK